MPTPTPAGGSVSTERGVPLRRIVLAVSFSAFLTSFDVGAINAALPLIQRAFACGISDVKWVLAADLLVTSGLLLVFGRLGDRFGARAVYLTGFVVFLCGCVLCGIAPSLPWLIAFRAFQGIGTAMLLANSPSVLVRHVPCAVRGSSFGVKASCLYLGLMAGPVTAGWMAGRFGWRAVFAMELPAALLGLVVAAVCIPPGPPPASRRPYDFAGACLWLVGLASFLWLLGYNRTAPMAGLFLALAALLLAIVLAARRHHPEALFHYSCFRRRPFSASVFSLALAFTASYMLTFILPFLLTGAWHARPSTVGQVLAVYALARSSVAWCSGRWSDRMDGRLLAIPGLILFLCGVVMLSRMDERAPLPVMAAALALAGVGFGCFVPPNNSALMGSAPRELYGFAAGIMATSRTVGMAVGVALAGAILSAAGGSLASGADRALGVAAMLALAAAITTALATPSPPPPPMV